jgi:hypothetical protein
MKNKPKNPRYSNIWNPDILLDYYLNINIEKYNEREKLQFLQTKIAVLLGFFLPYVKTNRGMGIPPFYTETCNYPKISEIKNGIIQN